MQYEPELYPVSDYKFNATSSLGIIAREYEVSQLVQLLQTMGKDTPYYPVMLKSIVDNMNVANREELIGLIDKASQPTPEQQKASEETNQAQLAFQASQTAALNAQAEESKMRAHKLHEEALIVPQELEIERIKAITANIKDGSEDDKQFERRLAVADRILKDKEIEYKSKGTQNGIPKRPPAGSGADQPELQQAFEQDSQARGAGGNIRVPSGL
jgi:hypothetical protein